MKKLFSFAVFLLIPFTVSAETVILAPITTNTTWTAASGPFLVSGQVNIEPGVTLTIEPGTVVKFTDGFAHLFVNNATLIAHGTAVAPIVFTSMKDDSAGGDTNGDGTTSAPHPADWNGLRGVNGGVLDIAYATIRYAGSTNNALFVGPGTLILDHVTVSDNQFNSIFVAHGATATVTNSSFMRDQYALQNNGTATFVNSSFSTGDAAFVGHPGSTLTLTNSTYTNLNFLGYFSAGSSLTATGGTATGTGIRGYQVTGSITTPTTWKRLDFPYLLTGQTNIEPTRTLTIEAGAVVKHMNAAGSFFVNGGALVAAGTAQAPVVITSLRDDSAGGDTNNDGTSTVSADADWTGVRVVNDGTAELTYTTIAYGGSSGYGIAALPGTLTLNHAIIKDNDSIGVLVGADTSATAIITRSTITGQQYGIYKTLGNASVHQSAISGNAQFGVYTLTAPNTDATNNWWGSASGPQHATNNVLGTGNGVSDNVNFSPFMTSLDQYNATKTYKVAVVLVEPYDVEHVSTSITAQPCKLIPEKTYPNGHDKTYYEDLYYCVADYYREVSKGTVNFKFTIFDNDGEWYKITNPLKTELWYGQSTRNNNDEDRGPELITDAAILVGENNLIGYDFVDVVHAGFSQQYTEDKNKISSVAVVPIDGQKPASGYKAIIAEKDPLGVFVHEFGHRLGGQIAPMNTFVPDLVDFGTNDASVNLFGIWDVMATGSTAVLGTSPTYFSSWSQQFLGWLYEDVYSKQSYGTYWIDALEQKKYGDNIFRYNLTNDATPLAEEYYILETRNRTIGMWDTGLPFALPGNLVLYYVNKNGSSKYGYDAENFSYVDKWTVTIPRGSNTLTGNGILPASGDVYRDFDHLVSIKTLGERVINGKYEISAEISPISFSDVSAGLSGSVLRVKNSLSTPSSNILNAPGPNDAVHAYNAYQEALKLQNFFHAAFVVTVLLLIVVIGLLFIKTTAAVRYISVFLFLVSLCITFFVGYSFRGKIFEYSSYNSCGVQRAEEEWGIIARVSDKKCRVLRAPSLSDVSPDLDLHAITPDGRHIGVNYATGEYENQIAGSIVSGDNQGIHEWIFVPEGETVRYYVSAHDNEAYLAAHPDIAETTDSFDIYARTIDPEAGIFTSTVLENQTIEPEQERIFEVSVSGGNPIVTPRNVLTLTPDNKTVALGAPLPDLSYTLLGFNEGDTVENSTTGLAACTTTATATSPVGTYPITCTAGDFASSTYVIYEFVAGTLTILPPLTVVGVPTTIAQGEIIPTLTASISGFINGDTAESATTGVPDCTTTATNTSPAGNYPITCAIGTLNAPNYLVTTYVDSILTILPTLTVTAHNTTIVEGQPIPSHTYTITGFLNGDTQASSTTGAPECTTTATATSVPGAYPIICTQGTLASSTYAFTSYIPGTLTIEPAIVIRPLTVTAHDKTVVQGNTLPVLTYTLSGFVNGDTQASATTGQPLCTTTATSTSPVGTYPITCTEGTFASTTYTIATYTDAVLTITDGTPPELQTVFDLALKDVVLSAIDTVDEQPVLTHTGNTITMTDSSGNTTTINLTKYKETATKLKLTYNSITRNGVTTPVPNTTIEYSWSLTNTNTLKDLDTKVKIQGEEKYTFMYNKGKDETKIKVKTGNSHTTTTRDGFVAVTVTTELGGVTVQY